MKKTTQLRQLLFSPSIEFLMEAHNGVSAKIVEEAGFGGIWASGLTLSASYGVRDNNELSWTQVLDALEFMSDNTTIPILLDGDTGYGNFNNLRRLVKKLGQRQIAGVCIEDKLFPKTNSFLRGVEQPLADVGEFCGKIKAAKDTQTDSDFVVLARTEAFIAGWGLEEALRRADAYVDAGADGVLVHSKRSDAKEIKDFMRAWRRKQPVVIVPTKYYSTPIEVYKDLGISMVIWANHLLRASITGMQKTARQVYKEKGLIGVENKIAPLTEIFRLQGDQELVDAEKKYLPTSGVNSNAIILAASQGDLGPLTEEVPKTLLSVNGKPVIEGLINCFNEIGVRDISVVRGFKKEKVTPSGVNLIDNDQYATTKEVYSLYCAKEKITANTIICYGDLLIRKHLLNDLVSDEGDFVIFAEVEYGEGKGHHEFVKTAEPYSRKLFGRSVQLSGSASGNKNPWAANPDGEFIGLIRLNERGAAALKRALEKFVDDGTLETARMPDIFNEVMKTCAIQVKFTKGYWLDINTVFDLQRANRWEEGAA